MFLLFSVLIVVYRIGSLSGSLSVAFQDVIPLNATAINMTWTVTSPGGINKTNNGVIRLMIDVCGISSSYSAVLSNQNASSINVSKWFVVAALNPDSVYHACLGSNWSSTDNKTQILRYPCKLVRTFTSGNKSLKPIPSIPHVTWKQIRNASTPIVYVDVMLFRELAISPWAKVQFGPRSVIESKIDTSFNGTHMMHRFIFDNLETPPKNYDLTTTIHLLANNAQCAFFGIGSVDKSVVKTTLRESSSGQRTSTLYSSALMLLITLLYIEL